MSGQNETAHCVGRVGNPPEPRTSAAAVADRQQHEPHGVANAEAGSAVDEITRVRRLHDDVESVVGVQ